MLTTREIEKRDKDFPNEIETKYKYLIKNSFDMMVLLDSDGIQHYVSESCEKILGYKPEELINIPVIDEMIHPEDREKTREGLKGIVEYSKHGGTQYRHRHKKGEWNFQGRVCVMDIF